MNQGEKTPRIVIIGAGPAGLSAARSLRDQGFHQVIIFEQNNTAGGKAKSIIVEGRVYEMGAVCGAANSRNLLEVMREVGARKGNWISSKGNHNYFNMKKEPIPLFNSFEIPVLMYQSLAKYYLLTRKHSKIFRPGFKDIDKELCKPFHAFCLENGLHLVEKAFSVVCSPFGYGYFEEVPAAYYMKYLSWPTICSIASWLPGSLFGVDGGVGTMWQDMAKHFDVRYEENIKGVFRQDVIRVETDKGEYSFDKMIITCPLDNLRNIMDCTPHETDLFSCIQYYDYHSSLVEVDDLSEKTCFIMDNFSQHRVGHPMAFYKRYNDTNLFTVYQIAGPGQDMETIEQILDNDLKQLGAKLKQIHAHDKWKYFPHVKKEELENGFYDKLEALQGERGTYFAGEIFNFATMEHTADYSRHIAQQLVRDHQREVAQNQKHKTTMYPFNSQSRLNSGEEWLPGCFSFCTG